MLLCTEAMTHMTVRQRVQDIMSFETKYFEHSGLESGFLGCLSKI